MNNPFKELDRYIPSADTQTETLPGNPYLEVLPQRANSNPYEGSACPADIYDYLLPDGNYFGLYSDPYATLKYVDGPTSSSSGRHWLDMKTMDNSFTEREISLLHFLIEHRLATTKQIVRAVFPDEPGKDVIKAFLKRNRNRGVLTALSWITPLNDGRKKPIVYGLTRPGITAAAELFHRNIPNGFTFIPTLFPNGMGPTMIPFFVDLAMNELYCELKRIDRLVSWQRTPHIPLPDGSHFFPGATVEVIKDAHESLRSFWVEVVRPSKEWLNRTRIRFERIETAYTKLNDNSRPVRLIMIADGDSRVPFLAELAARYMPSVPILFTTDERLINGLNINTFLHYNTENKELKGSSVSFLQEGYSGMTASAYLEQMSANIQEEDLDDEW
ncbi:replication-relaxation family protein [Aneurinibacillus tyrosinisolvens]|uniref:replication-relaxation family protein n=1 Tax=Aneurinibacillus tyrosinisolvens TaxID=1443435 RepID=UPI00063F5DDF|nr:replication-relaxation family protein [Aneurinibacillus tyrosinisolvens]